MNKQNVENLIRILGPFKDLKRSGWQKRGVLGPESDAEHTFSVAFLALLLAPQHLDKLRCLELALTHDLAEIYSGDPTPIDNVCPIQKHQEESAAIQRLAQELNFPKMIELFDEFEAQKTPESQFIKGLDKLDNVTTAAWYDKNQRSPEPLLPEFYPFAQSLLDKNKSPDINIIQDIFNQVI